MVLTVNGEPRELDAVTTVAELLTRLGLDSRAVVVEQNRRIVRRSELSGTPVHEGDTIELVHFVGGG